MCAVNMPKIVGFILLSEAAVILGVEREHFVSLLKKKGWLDPEDGTCAPNATELGIGKGLHRFGFAEGPDGAPVTYDLYLENELFEKLKKGLGK